ncbi:MAG: Ig-like domain-containing protein [Pseudomonadota bacterium]
MSTIASMQTAQVITGKMVREAMQEAKGDATQMKALQEVCDKCHGKFDDVRAFDKLVNFVQQYYQDCFEFKPNTSNPTASPARVTEARITKLQVVERTIDTTPPPPAPPGRYRDPLNITGHAEAGAKVEFYNASQPGRPVIGDCKADANGRFRFELTDETKFEFGDQIGIRVIDDSGKPSKPVVVPTEPFQATTTKITYTRYGSVVGNSESTTLQALNSKHDTRNPFFQNDKVTATFTPPAKAGDPYALELVGGDDSVEPNSTINVRVNGQDYVTKADSLGKFGLKVFGFEPGQRLKVEVKDINDKGIDVDYVAPPVALRLEALAGGVLKPPQASRPDADQVVGDGPPWVHFKAAGVTVPNGAVILRNTGTGDLFELNADEKGSINAAVGGIDNFDTLEIIARDASGNITSEASLAVMLPEKVGRGFGFLVPAEKLNQAQPDVTAVIEAIQGPPQDLFIHGQRDQRGPFLRMPNVEGLPPFGQLAVVREGKVMQYLRADQNGRLQGLLRGVNVGDQLNFMVLDAAGRKFPMELHGWRVPGLGETCKIPEKHVRSDDHTLKGCLDAVGKGSLDLEDAWLTPFTINTGSTTAPESDVALNYKREFFGARTDESKNESSFDYFPPALKDKFGLPAMNSAKLSLSENQGTSCLNFTYQGTNNQNYSSSVGVDYVMGQVNMGNPNSPIQVPQHLASLTLALKGALAFAAVAYDQGKEPGDLEYDRAMGAAKTMLYVFDRLAVQFPDQKDAITKAAQDAFPATGFPFELLGRGKVPPQDADATRAESSKPRTGAMSLIDARTALLGKVSGVGQVGDGERGAHPAPRIESASVLMFPQSNNNRGYQYDATPLRMKGRATPGDIVQIFNVSEGNKTLVAETVAGPDGKFSVVGGGNQVRSGDQLGVISLTRDGKQSAMMVVPTDSYLVRSGQVSTGVSAVPIKSDDRPPYFRTGATKLENSTFDKDGKMRGDSPLWALSGEQLAVEPFSTLVISSRTPDGKDHKTEVEVDGEGRFKAEFPHSARSTFGVTVRDRNGNQHHVNMSTPGLATSVQSGSQAVDANAGVVTFKLPSGEDVRGIVVAHTLGSTSRKDFTIDTVDRNDAFVDVVINQTFAYTDNDGRQGQGNYLFQIKIAKEDAARFNLQANEKINIAMPGFTGVPMASNTNVAMMPVGEATIQDRDYGSL